MNRGIPAVVRIVLVFVLSTVQMAVNARCNADADSMARWQEVKSKAFSQPDPEKRARDALALTACLGHPDPAIRDGLAFETLSAWLRSDVLTQATKQTILKHLSARMDDMDDAAGFARPFAALVLSELARADRIRPWMSDAERHAMVGRASDYLRSVTDRRGFVDGEGWRHGVAHGADWLMQLALNPAIGKSDLDGMLTAIAAQVAPPSASAYTHGESERLMRPLFYIAKRGLHDDAEWTGWFQRLSDPAPLGAWSDAYKSEAGLARRHNVIAFLQQVHVNTSRNEAVFAQVLFRETEAALRRID